MAFPPNEIVRVLHDSSQAYADKATELSNLIELVELAFQRMPGKAEVSVKGPGKWWVSFEKSGPGWKLFHHENGSVVPVTQANIEIKAAVAEVLPNLVNAILKTNDDRLQKINKALEALKEFPLLHLAIDEEGK